MNFSTFFSNIQESPWYRKFLNPVINEIGITGTLLDIGTGSGKMIQILSYEKGISSIGVDKNAEMLAEAKIKLKGTNTELVEIVPNEKLPFANNSFDYITICSVLFHLEKDGMNLMLKDSERLLKESGKIIVLTPTGKGGLLKLTRHFFSLKNLSIYVWYTATKKRAKLWAQQNYLKEYAAKSNLHYSSEIVMNGFAQLEILKQ